MDIVGIETECELLVSQKCYEPNPRQLLRRNGYEIFPLAGSVNGLL